MNRNEYKQRDLIRNASRKPSKTGLMKKPEGRPKAIDKAKRQLFIERFFRFLEDEDVDMVEFNEWETYEVEFQGDGFKVYIFDLAVCWRERKCG